MFKILSLLILSMGLVSCGPKYVDYFPCFDDGTPKPVVLIVPTKIACEQQLSQNMANELTRSMHYHLKDHGKWFVVSPEEMPKNFPGYQNIHFTDNENALAEKCKGAEFVVLTELIGYEAVPLKLRRRSCANECKLQMKMRIKIIDIRSTTPCLLLQEVYSCDYVMPNLAPEGFLDCSDTYLLETIISRAQEKLVIGVVKRIENIVGGVY